MSRKQAADIGASVRDRLRQKASGLGCDFQVLLTQYALERLLYRIGRSKYRGRLLLKGALLFNVWYRQLIRASMDADMLGRGESDIPGLVGIFRELCLIPAEADGLEFLPDTVRAEEIRENSEYPGVRMTLTAKLSGARIHLQIDVGFGDAVVPRPEKVDYPSLLDLPAPRVEAYTRYTVIAEKLQTIVDKGLANSRMKDYYDLWYISQHSDIEGPTLARAIAATFKRRKTVLPQTLSEGLGDYFAWDDSKQRQWNSFLKKNKPAEIVKLDEAIIEIRNFLAPAIGSLLEKKNFRKNWRPGKGWY